MRLLQWFYADTIEELTRIDQESFRVGLIERSRIRNLTPASNTTLPIGLDSSASQLPIDIVQLSASDTLPIPLIEGRVLTPIDPPVGTGEIIIGIGETYHLFITHHEPLSDTVRIQLTTNTDLFKGEIVPPSDFDTFAVGVAGAASLPLVVRIQSADVFSTNVIEGRKATLSFDSSDSCPIRMGESTSTQAQWSASEAMGMGLGESGGYVADYRQAVLYGLGVVETEAVRAAVTPADVLPLGTQEGGVIFYATSASALLPIQAVGTSTTTLLVAHDDQFGITLLFTAPEIFYVVLNNGDSFAVTVTDTGVIEITEFGEDPSLKNFPGMQATWEDNPYFSLA